MKHYIIFILVAFIIIGYLRTHDDIKKIKHITANVIKSELHKANSYDKTIFHYSERVYGEAIVTKIYPDKIEGSSHYQLFSIRRDEGDIMLLKHNIDIAPRIKNLKVGDKVKFYGVYEHRLRRGFVHETHHDINNRHINGWIKHKGVLYQ